MSATGNHTSDEEKASSSPESQKSTTSSSNQSSTSTNSSSPPSTPELDEHIEQQVFPRIHHAPHSSTPPRRGNRRARPSTSTRLGVIDESSSSVAPDIPTRNPNRKIPGFKERYNDAARFFSFSNYSRSEKDKDLPPPNAYDKIVGPRGEKFADVRQNRPFAQDHKRRKRRRIYIGAIVLVVLIAIGLAIGLGVGLTRRKKTEEVEVSQGGTSQGNNNDPEPFPIGTWAIPTYLTTSNTTCTSNSATWRCYPYSTYQSSTPSTSFSTLLWNISSPSNSTLDLQISNTQTTFSYPFTNIPLTLSNTNDVRLSAFTFTFSYRKQVVPDADITGDGAATRCYYNNTELSVRLYSSEQGAGGQGQIVGPPSGSSAADADGSWPYAIEYQETIGSGPECFRYQGGQETEAVQIAAGSGGDCVCGYRNFGLS